MQRTNEVEPSWASQQSLSFFTSSKQAVAFMFPPSFQQSIHPPISCVTFPNVPPRMTSRSTSEHSDSPLRQAVCSLWSENFPVTRSYVQSPDICSPLLTVSLHWALISAACAPKPVVRAINKGMRVLKYCIGLISRSINPQFNWCSVGFGSFSRRTHIWITFRIIYIMSNYVFIPRSSLSDDTCESAHPPHVFECQGRITNNTDKGSNQTTFEPPKCTWISVVSITG